MTFVVVLDRLMHAEKTQTMRAGTDDWIMTEAFHLPSECGVPPAPAPRERIVHGRRGLTKMFVRLSDALLSVIPVGYEDETGFHRGNTPAPHPQ